MGYRFRETGRDGNLCRPNLAPWWVLLWKKSLESGWNGGEILQIE